ncbi:hypothetical protein Tco_0516750 [Tanacetum coccineum]
MVKIHTDKNVTDLLTKAFNAKTVNGEVQLQALVDGKKIIVTEASIISDLQLNDEEGTDCLPNATIFEELTRMRYEKLSQKLTFYKAFFSPQWKFLIHTILQCLSAKTTAWNKFSSTMASAIICLATNQKFNFSKYIFESMVKNLDNVAEMSKGSAIPTDPHHTPTIIQPSTSQPQKKQRSRRPKRKDTKVPQPSGPTTNVADEAVYEERDDNLEKGATTVIGLDVEHDRVNKLEKKVGLRTHKLKRLYKVGRSARIVSSDEASLGDQEDASKQERKINDIDKDAEITLVDETQGRYGDDLMFDTNVLDDEEVFVAEQGVSDKDVKLSVDEVTLAQALAALKTASTRPKAKGLVIHEQEQAPTPIVFSQQLSSAKIQDKDKVKMIEPEPMKKLSKKDQLKLDEEVAQRLQAEFDEQERIEREKAEANIALKETWDDIQAKIEADQLLAERLQAREQEELTIEERAILFQQLLEKRRKHFAAKRAEEKRNRPPTKAQQRSIMCTYLKNMEGWKPKDLKSKSFANIQELFDKAMKRVNTFVDYRTELVEGSSKKADAEIAQESSSKRAGDELEQESIKKQKVDEDKETAELKSLMEVIPDEEEVAVDAIPLATKPPSIGRIVGIKRLLDDLRVTADKVCVTTASIKADNGKKNETKAYTFYRMENEEVYERLTYEVMMNGDKVMDRKLLILIKGELYFVDFIVNPEDDVEPCVIFGQSFLKLVKSIIDFGNGILTIWPEAITIVSDDDELDALLASINIDELLPNDITNFPPFVCNIGKGLRNNKKPTKTYKMTYDGEGPSLTVNHPKTQEELTKEELEGDLYKRVMLLNEKRPIIETLKYCDKHKMLLDCVLLNKLKLDGELELEEEIVRE